MTSPAFRSAIVLLSLFYFLASALEESSIALYPSRAETGLFADSIIVQTSHPRLFYTFNKTLTLQFDGSSLAQLTDFTVLPTRIVASVPPACEIHIFECTTTQDIGSRTICTKLSPARKITAPGGCTNSDSDGQKGLAFGRFYSVADDLLVTPSGRFQIYAFNLSTPGLELVANATLPISDRDGAGNSWITSILARTTTYPEFSVSGTIRIHTGGLVDGVNPFFCANLSHCLLPKDEWVMFTELNQDLAVRTVSVSNRTVHAVYPLGTKDLSFGLEAVDIQSRQSHGATVRTYTAPPSWFLARCDLFATAFTFLRPLEAYEKDCIYVITERPSEMQTGEFSEAWALTALAFPLGSTTVLEPIDIYPNLFGLSKFALQAFGSETVWTAVSERTLAVQLLSETVFLPRAPLGQQPCYPAGIMNCSEMLLQPCPKATVKSFSDVFGCVYCPPGFLPNALQTGCLSCPPGERCMPGFDRSFDPRLFVDQTNTPPFSPSEATESKDYLLRTFLPSNNRPGGASWIFGLLVAVLGLALGLIIISYAMLLCNTGKALRNAFKKIDLFYVVDRTCPQCPCSDQNSIGKFALTTKLCFYTIEPHHKLPLDRRETRPPKRLYTPVGGILTVASVVLALLVLTSAVNQLASYRPSSVTPESMGLHNPNDFPPEQNSPNSYRTVTTLSAGEGVGSSMVRTQLAHLKAHLTFAFQLAYLNFTNMAVCTAHNFKLEHSGVREDLIQLHADSNANTCFVRVNIASGAALEPIFSVGSSDNVLYTAVQITYNMTGSQDIYTVMTTTYQTTLLSSQEGIIDGKASAAFRITPVIRKSTLDVLMHNNDTVLYAPIQLELSSLLSKSVGEYSQLGVSRKLTISVESKSTGMLIEETPALDLGTAAVTMVVVGVSFANLISTVARKEKKLHHCCRAKCRPKTKKHSKSLMKETQEPLLEPGLGAAEIRED